MAVRFDALTDSLVTSGGLPAGDWTFLLWFKMSVNRATWSTVVRLYDDAIGRQTIVEADTTGNEFRLNSSDPLIATANTWNCITATRSGTTLVYRYGTDPNNMTTAPGITSATFTPTDLRIGGNNGVIDEWLNGSIANFKLYSSVLTADEQTIELQQYQPARTDTLNRWYPFLTVDLTEYSGNGFNLTAGSTATVVDDGPAIRWARSRGPRIKLSTTVPTPLLITLGSITDASTLNALSAAKPLTLPTVADTNSLNALAAQKKASLNTVASSDTPNAAKAVKTNALANVTETHTLNSLIRTIGATLALVTSSDTPNGLSTQKKNSLGSVTVSEALNVLRLGRGYNLPSVTDGASLFALTGQHRAALSLVTDSSTINGLSGKKLYTLGQIIDTSGTVQPLGETDSFFLGQTPVELAELFPLSVQKRCAISSITDATTVNALSKYKSKTLGTVTPTDEINPLGYGGSFTLGLITSSSTLFSPSASTVRRLGLIVSGSDLFVPTLEFDVLYAQIFGSVTQEHLVSANVGSGNNSSVVLTQKNDPVRADISVVTIDGSVETSTLFANAAAVVSKGGTVVTETIHGEARNA